MSKERELLKRLMIELTTEEDVVSLFNDIKECLAQPEQEPVTDKPTETAMAVMPNGVCVSNVYDAYEEGRKSLMSEQEPVAWIIVNKETGYRTQVSDLTPFLYHMEIFEVIPLYLAPPKREPLSFEDLNTMWCGNPIDFARRIESIHGIGEENE